MREGFTRTSSQGVLTGKLNDGTPITGVGHLKIGN